MQPEKTLGSIMAAMAQTIDKYMRGKNTQHAAVSKYLRLYRYEQATEMNCYMQEPAVCLIVQGRKRVMLGNEEYTYSKGYYLVTSVDLPLVAQILDASRDKPYLALTLQIDKKLISQLSLEDHSLPSKKRATMRGLAVNRLNLPMGRAFLHLTNMLFHPAEIAILAPSIYREILYRLLTSEQGDQIRQISNVDSRSYQVAKVIDWLTKNNTRQFKTDELAILAEMSTSSLRYHFQTVTAMSPLQFQNKMRLNTIKQHGKIESRINSSNCIQFRKKCSHIFVNHCRHLDYWT